MFELSDRDCYIFFSLIVVGIVGITLLIEHGIRLLF